MAGPCASIYVSAAAGEIAADVAATIVSAVASTVKGADFWVTSTEPIGGAYTGEGSPFFLEISRVDALDPLCVTTLPELEQIAQFSGFAPAVSVGICAMCNGRDEHRILGELLVAIARELDGTIDFDGELETIDDAERLRLPGKSARVVVDDDDRRRGYIVADSAFLEAWLRHPSFRMVK